MTMRSKCAAFSLGLATMLGAASAPTWAQTPAETKPATAALAKKKPDPSRRVPPYFGQIGLTPDQKESIYKVRKSHQEKIDSLKKEIAQIEGKMMGDCESLLNDDQKKLLTNLRRAAVEGQKTTATEPAKTGVTTKSAK